MSRLDSTCWLLYYPMVYRGSLQVVIALFCVIIILHVRVYDSSLIIRASGFIQTKLIARSKQLVKSILPLILSLRNPLYPLPLRCDVLRWIRALDNILTFLSGYDTLEYSWVKALMIFVRMQILFVTLQNVNSTPIRDDLIRYSESWGISSMSSIALEVFVTVTGLT
jgi:hypothetical protein